MRRAAGRSVAGVTSVLGSAVLCAAVLAGCQAHGAVSQQPADGVLTPVSPSATTSAAPVNGAGAVVSATTGGASAPSDAGIDSDLNAVDGQLSGLDSALAQATQSPSDGG